MFQAELTELECNDWRLFPCYWRVEFLELDLKFHFWKCFYIWKYRMLYEKLILFLCITERILDLVRLMQE